MSRVHTPETVRRVTKWQETTESNIEASLSSVDLATRRQMSGQGRSRPPRMGPITQDFPSSIGPHNVCLGETTGLRTQASGLRRHEAAPGTEPALDRDIRRLVADPYRSSIFRAAIPDVSRLPQERRSTHHEQY